MESHAERIARVRQAYRDAHERFVARLRGAPEDAVHRAPGDGGWSAAQIGWHVAAVDASFAALLSGASPAAKPVADAAPVKTWGELAAAMPEKLEAGKRVQPPADVRRDDVLKALSDAASKMDAALAGLTEERGLGYAVTHPVIGTVALTHVGDWAAAHVARHNKQAKRVLGTTDNHHG